MLVLDIQRTKEDFLRKKGKSSVSTLRAYENIFKNFEKFSQIRYNSGMENIIKELALVDNCQEQVENLLQTYIDDLEGQNRVTQI